MTHSTAHAGPLVQRSRIHAWFTAHPRVLDVAVILASTVPQIIALTLQDVPNEWLAQLCIAGAAVALWFRRSHPLAVLFVVSAVVAANPLYASAGVAGAGRPPSAGSPELWFAAYALGAGAPLRVAVLGLLGSNVILGVGGALVSLGGAAVPPRAGIDVIGLLVLVIGVAVRARNSRRDALEEVAALREDRAVAAERARITAEMHDVVAHSAAVMIALAGGARAGWEKHPERARAALEQLGTVGAQALEEMQRTLRVLREGDGALSARGSGAIGAAVAARSDGGIARSGYDLPPLSELVSVFRAAGLTVELAVPEELPEDPVLRTTLYRIVQESLTNALRHATGASLVEVDIERVEQAIVVTVTDDGGGSATRAGAAVAPAQPGFGLRAMAERADAFGGTLEAGPLPATSWSARGGWRTRATLPLATGGSSRE